MFEKLTVEELKLHICNSTYSEIDELKAYCEEMIEAKKLQLQSED